MSLLHTNKNYVRWTIIFYQKLPAPHSPCYHLPWVGIRLISQRLVLVTITTAHQPARGRPCGRGLALTIVSSLCLINSESLHGFCHFHLNCKSHCWWLLFHLHSFPPCPRATNFFIDSCPSGTICTTAKFTILAKEGQHIPIQ